jgi:CHAT domain-containing protein
MAVVAAIVVVFAPSRASDWMYHSGGASALVAAANARTYRNVAGRLGGFEHRRWAERLRATDDISAWQFRQAAAVAAQYSSSPAARRHIVGVGLLLAERSDDAVHTLEQALLESTGDEQPVTALHRARDARLLSDLAVAYLHRGDGAADAFKAVEAAECAWRIEHSPEVAWNRAVAREAVHVRRAALEAWGDFLNIEPESPWAPEAVAHIRRIVQPSLTQRWLAASARLGGPGADYVALAREFPQQLRMYGEEVVLSEWAHAILRGDDAAVPLRTARMIGAAIAGGGGDHLLADNIRLIDRTSDLSALRRLAAAQVRYAAGRQLYKTQHHNAAAHELMEAARLFTDLDAPFAARSALYAGAANYYAGHLAQAHASLVATLAGVTDRERYPALVGQLEWTLGLIDASRGNNNEAAAAYHVALAAFRRTSETENRVGIETQLTGLHRSLGNEAAMLADQQRALASLEELGTTGRSHAILTEAAFTADALQLPLAAMLFQDVVVTSARLSHDPVSICDALISRSRYAAAADRRQVAERDLRESGQLLASIADEGMRARCTSNLRAAEVRVWRTFDPWRAAGAARAALAEMERLDHRVVMVQLRLELGRALRATGRTTEALASWREGIEECERQRADLAAQDDRRTYFEQCRALFDESVGTLARGGRFAEAWLLAETGRARGLREILATAARPNPISIPRDVTVLEFSLLPDAVVVWSLGADGAWASIRSASPGEIRSSIETLASKEATPDEQRVRAAALYDLLIAPVAPRLRQRVIIVPDMEIYRVPFGALLNRHSGRYFIEDHEISLAPSLELLSSSSNARWREPRSAVLIDAGAAGNESGGLGILPSASAEIAAVARIYANSVIVGDERCKKSNVLHAIPAGEMVHFAGHEITGSEMVEPALVLRPSADDSGLLYPHEIATLSLKRAKLVVLGACGTAGGQVGSEGAMSIARAFLAAGAERVVGTLWPVEDEQSAALLTSFHRALRAGNDPAAALRAAQIQRIRHSIRMHEWAAFEVLQRTH